MELKRVAIVGGSRLPFCRSFTKYNGVSNQELLTAALKGLVDKFNLQGQLIDEVACGAVMKFPSDWNMTRESVLGSGLHPATPAYDVQRACGTSLETTIQLAHKIAMGQIDVAIAGGTDTNSDLPVLFPKSFTKKLLEVKSGKTMTDKLMPLLKVRPNDFKPVFPGITEPRTGKTMGQHCEMMAKEWKITREDQDQLAYESHKKGVEAYERGFYKDLLTPFKGLDKDAILRPDTTAEKLAKLRPAFDRENGTLTAGNSTALTDGASAVLLCSEEYAKEKGWPVLAYFKMGQHAAVDFVGGDGLLMAPTVAVGKMLDRAGLTLQDFDLYEIHEAFAAQVLCTLKAWESAPYCKKYLNTDAPLGSIDRDKMNVNGGSVAMGHPFAATGARIVASLAKALQEGDKKRGLISICTAGGMGVAAILERD